MKMELTVFLKRKLSEKLGFLVSSKLGFSDSPIWISSNLVGTNRLLPLFSSQPRGRKSSRQSESKKNRKGVPPLEFLAPDRCGRRPLVYNPAAVYIKIIPWCQYNRFC